MTKMDRLEQLLRYHDDDPEDGFVRFAVAMEYLKLGRDGEALSWFEKLAGDQPDYVGTWFHLGRLYQRLGRREDAVRTFEEGIAHATRLRDGHARSELQAALMEAQGIGEDL